MSSTLLEKCQIQMLEVTLLKIESTMASEIVTLSTTQSLDEWNVADDE